MNENTKKVRVPDLAKKKQRGERIAMLTAYDATMARLLDDAGVDLLLVGDSLGMVIQGHETTIPVTLDAVIHHTRAVVNGARRALVVADMPFLTYQADVAEGVRNAGRLIQEGGASAVKMEGGRPTLDLVWRLVEIGIPVMGHLGLTPQSYHQLGGFRRTGTNPEDVERLLEDARLLEQNGAFAVVLESIPSAVAKLITGNLSIPTIGIGAGPYCDGQVLVSYDIFGLYPGRVPSFVKQYANLGEQMVAAARQYVADVKGGAYPAPETSVEAGADHDPKTH